jgi:hypothetical protein
MTKNQSRHSSNDKVRFHGGVRFAVEASFASELSG